MPAHANHTLALYPHAGTRCDAVRSIVARAAKTPDGMLALGYVIEGHLDRLRLPAPRPPAIGERLWQHSCCEVFVAREGLPAYHEFNFSPSGEWAAHAFARYREGAPLVDAGLDPQLAVRRSPERLQLDASIRLDRLSPQHAEAKLRLALAAVIEDADGKLSYWALRHAAGAPDFHHPDAYALELE